MTLVITAFTLILMYLYNKTRQYKLISVISVILLSDILFPLKFFSAGGLHSGMVGYFVLSIFVIFILTEGVYLYILLSIHILLVTACYFIAYRYPDFIPAFTEQQVFLDSVESFVLSGLFVGVVFLFQRALYVAEKKKTESIMQEYQKTLANLEHQDALLHTINDATGLLLNTNSDGFSVDFWNCFNMFANSVEADRIYICKKNSKNNAQSCTQIYRWLKGDELCQGDGNCLDAECVTHFPELEGELSTGHHINGITRDFPEHVRKILERRKTLSILIAPVFLKDEMWGLVVFENCAKERLYSADEVSILRSASLLIANAMLRNENEEIIKKRLAQQELMSKVSQSFISTEPMANLINATLRAVGEFMGVTKTLIITADKKMDESYLKYVWCVSGCAITPDTPVAFSGLIRESFPQTFPSCGEVPAVCCDDIRADYGGRYKSLEKALIQSFVWAPIYVGGEYWGLISVEENRQQRIWTESDAQLVSLIASSISGAVARDIVDRDRVAALEQAVQASKAKSDFLSHMSHEMRTPMNAIIGMTSIGKHAQDLEKKDYAFGKIDDASTHLLGVINDILDMSKIEANKLELCLVPFEFEKMLRKITNVINFRIEEKQLDFRVNIDNAIPRVIVGDEQRLTQVITNLLANASKFTSEGGQIRLSAILNGEKDGKYEIQVTVSDTGIGITKEQQARLFTSFEQAETGTSRKYGGTGLGLAISKRIVEMMDGRIWIDSDYGTGSTFSFIFMAERAAEESVSLNLLHSGVIWDRIRILVVDDDTDILDYFEETAQSLGLRCETAGSGAEALSAIEKNGFYDIYFIDWKMPVMSGAELAKKIKTLTPPEQKSLVAVITGTEWSVIEDEAKSAGVSKYLQKPLFPSAIVDCLNECFSEEAAAVQHNKDETVDFSGYTVLLAEDVEINREIVLALLKPTNLSIDCAGNGREAVRMFTEHPKKYDIIFMDIQMPEMDGYTATRAIRSSDVPYGASIPIIAMTANVFREDIDNCLSAGMNDHVGKPLNLDDVIEKLRFHLPERS